MRVTITVEFTAEVPEGADLDSLYLHVPPDTVGVTDGGEFTAKVDDEHTTIRVEKDDA